MLSNVYFNIPEIGATTTGSIRPDLPTKSVTLIGHTTTDTLYNKTIVDKSNIIAANKILNTDGSLTTINSSIPLINQVLTGTSTNTANWSYIGGAPATNEVVYVSKNGTITGNGSFSAPFASISAALAIITDASANKPYSIVIFAGNYTENNPLTIGSYINIIGVDMSSINISAAVATATLFICNSNVAIGNITIMGSATPGFAAIDISNTVGCDINMVDIMGGYNGIICNCTGTAVCNTQVSMMKFFDITNNAINVTTTGTASMSYNTRDINILTTTITPITAILISGAGVTFNSTGCNLTGLNGTSGIGIQATSGSDVNLRAGAFINWLTAINNPNTGAGIILELSGIQFINNGININILNPGTTGFNDSFSDYSKTMVVDASTWFITTRQKQTIQVAIKGGDYNDIATAIASIGVLTPAASASFRYVIMVAPGNYNISAPITVPSYVTIRGATSDISIISSSVSPTIIGNPEAVLFSIKINCPTGTCIQYYGSNSLLLPLRMIDVKFGPSLQFTDFNNTAGICSVFMVLSTVDTQIQPTNGLSIINASVILNTGIFQMNGGLLQNVFSISGASAALIIMNSFIKIKSGGPSGTGINIAGGATATIQGSILDSFVTGINVPLDATTPTIKVNATTINNCTTSINIANPNCSGSISATAPKAGVSIISTNTSISAFIFDPTTGNSSFTQNGHYFFGRTFPQATDITGTILDTSVCGLTSGGAISNPAGLQVSAAAGTGYLLKTAATDYYQYMSWGALGPITVTAQSTNYIYIDNNGNLASSVVIPDATHTILLGSVVAVAATIILIEKTPQLGTQLATKVDSQMKQSFGAVYTSGSLVVIAGVNLNVSNGSYFFGANGAFNPVGASPITFSLIYSVGPTTNVQLDQVTTTVPLATFNNITTGLAAVPAAQFTAHALYCYTDGVTTTYIMRYGQATFATQTAAQGYVVASGMDPGIPIIATIIVQQGAAAITAVVDRRPFLSTVTGAFTPTITAHSALTGLTTGNDHPQYFRVDGTSPMTATINNGGFGIINNTTINGVSITAHAARHLPGGADALTTAAPVTIGSANSTGIAASFSQSDHIHAHGVQTDPTMHAVVTGAANGFMIAADKTKLDASTSANTASTIIFRSAGGQFDISSVRFISGANAITMIAPGGSTTWQFTLPANSGTSGQFLITDGAGNTSWSSSAIVDPTTTIGDIIYRNNSNVLTRLPTGGLGRSLRSANTTFNNAVMPTVGTTWLRTWADPRVESIIFDDFTAENPAADLNWTSKITGTADFISIAIPANTLGVISSVGWTELSATATAGVGSTSLNLSINSMTLLGSMIELEFGFQIIALSSAMEQGKIKIGIIDSDQPFVAPGNGLWLQIGGFPMTFTANSAAGGLTTSYAIAAATPNTSTTYRCRILTNYGVTSAQFYLQSSGATTLTNTLVATATATLPNTSANLFGPGIQVSKTLGNMNTIGIWIDYYYLRTSFVNFGRSEFS